MNLFGISGAIWSQKQTKEFSPNFYDFLQNKNHGFFFSCGYDWQVCVGRIILVILLFLLILILYELIWDIWGHMVPNADKGIFHLIFTISCKIKIMDFFSLVDMMGKCV